MPGWKLALYIETTQIPTYKDRIYTPTKYNMRPLGLVLYLHAVLFLPFNSTFLTSVCINLHFSAFLMQKGPPGNCGHDPWIHSHLFPADQLQTQPYRMGRLLMKEPESLSLFHLQTPLPSLVLSCWMQSWRWQLVGLVCQTHHTSAGTPGAKGGGGGVGGVRGGRGGAGGRGEERRR